MAVRYKHIRSLVNQLLEGLEIHRGPVPVEKVAESLGVDVRWEPADPDLSGFLLRDPKDRRAIIGVNSKHHKNRQRFTIGHELGHFLLHQGEKVHIDSLNRAFEVKLRDEESGTGTDSEEREANLFAAELLMPESFLKEDLAKLDTLDLFRQDVLKPLARKYGVSTEALTFRLAYLNYIKL